MFDTLTLALDGPLAILTLSRPEKGNAFDADMHREFTQALATVENAPHVRALLLMGEGKVFSAGGDFSYIRQLRTDPELRKWSFAEGLEMVNLLTGLRVPLVTAVHGHAIGLGATIVALSDISVAWKDAKIADPHVQVGLVAGDGGVIGWSSAIGFNRAKRYLLTGDALTGTHAHALGLVTDLADTPDEAKAQARALAEKIIALPPIAIQGTKRAFNALAAVRNGDAQRVAFEAEHISLASNDLEEAMTAMTERRPPRYTNS